jgi:hypothetical protein
MKGIQKTFMRHRAFKKNDSTSTSKKGKEALSFC